MSVSSSVMEFLNHSMKNTVTGKTRGRKAEALWGQVWKINASESKHALKAGYQGKALSCWGTRAGSHCHVHGPHGSFSCLAS